MTIPPALVIVPIFLVAIYAILIAWFTSGLNSLLRKAPSPRSHRTPFVTVIAAMRNEADALADLLRSLIGQDYPAGQWEMILSDDHSDDGSAEIAKAFSRDHPGLPLKIVRPLTPADPAGKKAAIARAVEQSKGEILLFTDADTVRGEKWIASMAAGFDDPRAAMVLGPVCFSGGGGLFHRIQSMEFLGLMGVTAGSAALGRPVMGNGANLACRREAWLKVNGGRKDLGLVSGDDQFLVMAVRKQAGADAVVFRADRGAVVTTLPETRWKGFLHQRLRWVSKSRGYRDPMVIATGLVTGLAHLILLVSLVSLFMIPAIWPLTLSLMALKMMADAPVVWRMKRFFGIRANIADYVIAQLFQIFYVPVAGLLGFFIPYDWKGRRASATARS